MTGKYKVKKTDSYNQDKKKQHFYWLGQKWENKLDNLKLTLDIEGKRSREENEWQIRFIKKCSYRFKAGY